MAREMLIEFHDVCFSYGANEVLHNVNFTVERGDMLAIVGPNGGGKTTLLRLMLGLVEPARGRVLLMGRPPCRECRRVGYVMQALQFDPQFPVCAEDIVLMGRVERRVFGGYSAADRRAATDALARVGMADLGSRPFAALSGGQRQRVLIAQALACEPELLVLDEPTASIDSDGEHQIYELLTALNRTGPSLTVALVSHNVNVVLSTATHVLCVNHTAVVNRLADLHPTALAGVTDMAVLHHALNCHVFDSSHAMEAPHHVQGAREVA